MIIVHSSSFSQKRKEEKANGLIKQPWTHLAVLWPLNVLVCFGQKSNTVVIIVSAYVKVMSQMQIPITLHVYEAPCMVDSDVTLLSEY